MTLDENDLVNDIWEHPESRAEALYQGALNNCSLRHLDKVRYKTIAEGLDAVLAMPADERMIARVAFDKILPDSVKEALTESIMDSPVRVRKLRMRANLTPVEQEMLK